MLNRKETLENSRLYSLRPYLDDQDILRISSRFNESKFHSNEKNPIIVPKESKFAVLIVKEKHLRLLHGGVTLTLSQIRRKYWIPQGRQLIRKIINKCLACKKYSVKSADQLSGQLPRDRISESPPLTVIGVDFTGPVYVKLGNDTEKSYIALFTCAVTRAVYIELVIAEGITWKFIVELAPSWGGFYERLMRSIKEPLRKIIVSDDVSDPEPLTPANFLLVGHKNDYPFNFSELLNNSITRESLLKRKYHQTKLLSQFWKKWKDNYFLNIRSFHHFPKPSVERNLRVGDVVILEGNTKSKFLWDLGRIAKVMKGRDGLVRSCVVKTKKGEIKRPVQLIYPPKLSET
ncbi:transposable element Tcb2 transposase [Trichonephila clavata]|uniref:Transposable element Tcb2 transposase n=1 Tax=Trichonephila clavata TaxID=2740835 RepID=A0A8X6FRA5_TRICU|nr:transposable element Tcb2 transposase [Trichonephila clavata]